MRYPLLGLSAVALALACSPAHAQEPTNENLCIVQVQEQYAALGRDQTLQATPNLPWAAQFGEIVKALKVQTTMVGIKSGQATMAERQLADFVTQLQDKQARITALESQVTALRAELDKRAEGSPVVTAPPGPSGTAPQAATSPSSN